MCRVGGRQKSALGAGLLRLLLERGAAVRGFPHAVLCAVSKGVWLFFLYCGGLQELCTVCALGTVLNVAVIL